LTTATYGKVDRHGGQRRGRRDRRRLDIRTADGALSAHAEHTIVITRDDPIVLTA
jgi:hypothetical protein